MFDRRWRQWPVEVVANEAGMILVSECERRAVPAGGPDAYHAIVTGFAAQGEDHRRGQERERRRRQATTSNAGDFEIAHAVNIRTLAIELGQVLVQDALDSSRRFADRAQQARWFALRARSFVMRCVTITRSHCACELRPS